MEEIRCFIAIELPDELKNELTRLQSSLKARENFPVKWVDPQSLHLTLKFLGGVAVNRIEEITRGIEPAAKEIAPFRLEVRELGIFPNPRRTQIAWVGVTGEVDVLKLLQKRLEACIAPMGFPTEAREFTAHLTLARVRDRATPEERQQFGQLITGTRFAATTVIEVDAINLIKSQLTPQGPVYTRIATISLRKPL